MIDKYFSAFFLAIFTTSILAYAPQLLPSLILGAVVIGVFFIKFWDWLGRFDWRVYITSIISAAFLAFSWYYFNLQAVGLLNVLYIVLGFSWLFVAIHSLRTDIYKAMGITNE